MSYTFDFKILYEYSGYITGGIGFTCLIGIISIAIATTCGMVLALMQLSRRSPLQKISITCVYLFRALPVVVLLFWIHYGLPILTGLNTNAFWSSIIALSLNGSALACEAFRGGLSAIPETQSQAAGSLGLSRYQFLRYVLVPQAFYATLPPLTNVHITILKNVSVTLLIAVPEIMFRVQSLSLQYFRPLEFYTGAAILYLILISSYSALMYGLEKLQKWQPT